MRTFLTAAALLVLAVPASAADFCVGAPTGCVGTNFTAGQLQAAIDAAEVATSPPHRVVIAAGTYTGPFTLSGATGVEIVGAGAGQTVLTNGATAGTTALTVTNSAGHEVRDLTLKALGTGYALEVFGGHVHHVALLADPGSNTAMVVVGGALVQHATVSVGAGVQGAITGGSDGTIEDTVFTRTAGGDNSDIAVAHSGTGPVPVLRRVRITAFGYGVVTDAGTVRVEDSVIDLGVTNGRAFTAANPNNSDEAMLVEVVRSTVIGSGDALAFRVVATGIGTQSAAITAVDTVSWLPNGGPYQCSGDAGNAAGLTLTNVSHVGGQSAHNLCTRTFTLTQELTTTDPLFVDAAAGDVRPVAGASIVDTGSTSPPGGALDFLRNTRVVNGTVDRGAVEYQRRAPELTSVTATPPSQAVGAGPVALAAVATDADGDPLTFAWDFGDGQNGTGANPSHSYGAAGVYTATVTVTDATGLTDAQPVQVTVTGTLQASSPPAVVTDGSPAFGETVTATPGVWPSAGQVTREWRSCDRAGANCVAIPGATGTSLVLGAALVGRTVRVVERQTSAAGSGESVSAQTAPVVRRPFVIRRPRVLGVVRPGRVVRCGLVRFGGFPAPKAGYRWVRDGKLVPRATRPTYTVRSGDAGKRLSCRVTARNALGTVVTNSPRVLVRR